MKRKFYDFLTLLTSTEKVLTWAAFELAPVETPNLIYIQQDATRACQCVRKRTQHNVCTYCNLKANECSSVYIEVKANIL